MIGYDTVDGLSRDHVVPAHVVLKKSQINGSSFRL